MERFESEKSFLPKFETSFGYEPEDLSVIRPFCPTCKAFNPAIRQALPAVERADSSAYDGGDSVVILSVIDRPHQGFFRIMPVAHEDIQDAGHGLQKIRPGMPDFTGLHDAQVVGMRPGQLFADKLVQRAIEGVFHTTASRGVPDPALKIGGDGGVSFRPPVWRRGSLHVQQLPEHGREGQA